MSIIHDQREIRSGAIGASATRGVRCYVSLPAHGERGVEYSSPSCFDAVTSINWPGRFAKRRSGLFRFHVTLRSSPVERHRQRAGANPLGYRLSAAFKFVRAVMAARRQLKTSPHKFARQSTESLGLHLERLSRVHGSYTQEHGTDERQIIGTIRQTDGDDRDRRRHLN